MINDLFWKGKKVFVTGHTGFKGSWLCLWLSSLGAEVTGYALQPPTEPSLFNLAGIDKMVNSIIGDIRDFDSLYSSINTTKPEIIFHMAAQPIVRESYKFPVDTYAINVMGTVNLLEAIRLCGGVKAVVNVTTDKVYDNKEWLWGYRENDTLGGYDPYSNSKACSDLVTSAYRNSYFNSKDYNKHGTALASVRAGNVIGGGDWASDRLIPDCIQAILLGEKIIVRNPYSTRPWQHVIEPLSGYMTLAEKLYTDGIKYADVWNFGSKDEDCRSVGDLVELFCETWGEGAECEIRKTEGPHEAGFLKLDCSKAKNVLNWESKWRIEQAIRATVEWTKCYRDNGNIVECMKNQIKTYCDGV